MVYSKTDGQENSRGERGLVTLAQKEKTIETWWRDKVEETVKGFPV